MTKINEIYTRLFYEIKTLMENEHLEYITEKQFDEILINDMIEKGYNYSVYYMIKKMLKTKLKEYIIDKGGN